MTEQNRLKLLAEVKAIITNSHIVYTSGKHGAAYVNKDAVYPHTEKISALAQDIADYFADYGIQAVIAPAIGGVVLSQWVAHHLTKSGDEVISVYAEKATDSDAFVIKRGYDKLIAGKKVLVVEDVLTTGGSVKKVIEATRAVNAEIVGLGVLCNRGGITAQDVGDVPELFALVNVELESWDEADCPLCAQEVPVNTDVGKGREYINQKQAIEQGNIC